MTVCLKTFHMQSLFVVVIVLLCSLAKSDFQTGFKIEIKFFLFMMSTYTSMNCFFRLKENINDPHNHVLE